MRAILAVLVVLLLPSAAVAEQQVTLTMGLSEAQAALNKLAESPWKDVNPLMQKLIGQLNTQLVPKPEARPPESKTEAKPTSPPESEHTEPKQ